MLIYRVPRLNECKIYPPGSWWLILSIVRRRLDAHCGILREQILPSLSSLNLYQNCCVGELNVIILSLLTWTWKNTLLFLCYEKMDVRNQRLQHKASLTTSCCAGNSVNIKSVKWRTICPCWRMTLNFLFSYKKHKCLNSVVLILLLREKLFL